MLGNLANEVIFKKAFTDKIEVLRKGGRKIKQKQIKEKIRKS